LTAAFTYGPKNYKILKSPLQRQPFGPQTERMLGY